ncbi:MAG: hypothetical protein V3W34_14145 [Phycisphaerae bacterium]
MTTVQSGTGGTGVSLMHVKGMFEQWKSKKTGRIKDQSVPRVPPSITGQKRGCGTGCDAISTLIYDEHLDGLVLPGLSDQEYGLLAMLHGKPAPTRRKR